MFTSDSMVLTGCNVVAIKKRNNSIQSNVNRFITVWLDLGLQATLTWILGLIRNDAAHKVRLSAAQVCHQLVQILLYLRQKIHSFYPFSASIWRTFAQSNEPCVAVKQSGRKLLFSSSVWFEIWNHQLKRQKILNIK